MLSFSSLFPQTSNFLGFSLKTVKNIYYFTNSVLFQNKVLLGCLNLLNFHQKAIFPGMPVKENLAHEKCRRLLGIRINYLYSTVQSIDFFFAMKQHESKWMARYESTSCFSVPLSLIQHISACLSLPAQWRISLCLPSVNKMRAFASG